jgi:hypothetical protein
MVDRCLVTHTLKKKKKVQLTTSAARLWVVLGVGIPGPRCVQFYLCSRIGFRLRAGAVAWGVQWLFCKHEALSSSPSPTFQKNSLEKDKEGRSVPCAKRWTLSILCAWNVQVYGVVLLHQRHFLCDSARLLYHSSIPDLELGAFMSA